MSSNSRAACSPNGSSTTLGQHRLRGLIFAAGQIRTAVLHIVSRIIDAVVAKLMMEDRSLCTLARGFVWFIHRFSAFQAS
jgi:hypothetical protein